MINGASSHASQGQAPNENQQNIHAVHGSIISTRSAPTYLREARRAQVGLGRVEVDGKDVREVGVHALRQRLAIIPQDPVLFSGTLR